MEGEVGRNREEKRENCNQETLCEGKKSVFNKRGKKEASHRKEKVR